MTRTYKIWGALAAAALMAEGLVFVAFAQAPPRGQAAAGQAQPGAVRVQANKPVMEANHDRALAQWLVVVNSAEVKEAKFAQGHTSSATVREFCQTLEHDHSNAVQQLEKFLGNEGGQGQQGGQGQGFQGQTAMRGTDLPYLTIFREISEQFLATTEKELEAKKGNEFDQAFVGSQIDDHCRVLATMKVLGEYASPDLRKIIDSQTQVATGHLDRAKALEKSFMSR